MVSLDADTDTNSSANADCSGNDDSGAETV